MKMRIAIIVLIAICLIACIAIADSLEYQYAQVVTQKGPLNMRKTASTKASIIDKIPKSTILTITPVDDVWCKCTYNDKDGYVMTKYLSVMDLSQFRTLSLNDTGQDVLDLKEKLQALYFYDTDAEINDRYDSNTEATVKLFQSKQGWEETGVATPELQAFITWGPAMNNLPTRKMTVSIKCSCSGYNHVGSQWSKYFSINGSKISSGDMIDIVLGESISVYSKITESDSKPDVGSIKENIEITQEFYDNGFTVTHKVTVKENKGRYAGYKAVWTVIYTFAP